MSMKLELYEFNAPLPENVLLALAIAGRVEPDGQRHTGFVVRDFTDRCLLFHLGSNNNYAQNDLTDEYSYLLVPALAPATANAIISFLLLLLQNTNGQVPYSIAWDNVEYFDKEGQLVKTGPADGFTCATFVLETLKRYGLELVDRATWPITKASEDWQKWILPLLNLPVENYKAQLELAGKYPRVRPEEALGAAHYYKGEKLPYPVVAPAGVEVVKEMIRLRVVATQAVQDEEKGGDNLKASVS
ncbi:hypothetical protein [Pseudomonas sp. S2_H10]